MKSEGKNVMHGVRGLNWSYMNCDGGLITAHTNAISVTLCKVLSGDFATLIIFT